MPLLFIIGTLCALGVTVFYRRKNSFEIMGRRIQIRTPKGFVDVETAEREARETHLREHETWLREHTDEFFGRPVGEGYVAPFPHKKEGYVPIEIADEYPNRDQRYVFEWIADTWPKILADASGHLFAAQSDHFQQEELRGAFDPNRLKSVSLRGSQPVKWTIFFETDIGEGEAFRSRIDGEDQRMLDAQLYM